MKIGVILCAYATEDTLNKCLQPWADFIKNSTDHSVTIAAISYPFIGFCKQDNLGTIQNLEKWKRKGVISEIFTGENPLPETEVRNLGLKHILNNGADLIVLLDSDEIYNSWDIYKFINHTLEKKEFSCFKMNFKNVMFDGDYYIEGFDPARVFKKRWQDWEVYKFYDDNSLLYVNYKTAKICRDVDLKFTIIPKSICYPLHYSWLNNERSKLKVNYQIAHFGRGNPDECSYKWNEEKKKLEFNLNYYTKYNKEIPKLKKL